MARRKRIAFTNLTAYVDAQINAGRTLKEVAEDLDLSIGYLSDLKNGKTTPGFKLAKRLSDRLNIPLASFLEQVAS